MRGALCALEPLGMPREKTGEMDTGYKRGVFKVRRARMHISNEPRNLITVVRATESGP